MWILADTMGTEQTASRRHPTPWAQGGPVRLQGPPARGSVSSGKHQRGRARAQLKGPLISPVQWPPALPRAGRIMLGQDIHSWTILGTRPRGRRWNTMGWILPRRYWGKSGVIPLGQILPCRYWDKSGVTLLGRIRPRQYWGKSRVTPLGRILPHRLGVNPESLHWA